MKYLAHQAHKDGGSVCGHDGCTAQALIAESLKCTTKTCKQATAELEARFKNIDWPALIPNHLVDIEQRQATLDALKAKAAETNSPLPGIAIQIQKEIATFTTDRGDRVASAKAEWRERMTANLNPHDHPHYRCAKHAGDLGKHVAGASASLSN